MDDVRKIFGMGKAPPGFSTPERQSVEQTEDYAIKKVVHTQELIVAGTPYSPGGGGHVPTSYVGTDFVGVNPNKTLTHSRVLADNTILVIGGRIMHRTLEYTIAGAVITMVNVDIDDADNVMVVD